LNLFSSQDSPGDYVIATGESHSVREFVEKAFGYAGISIKWQGVDENEVGIDTNTNQIIVRIDPRYFRPTEVNSLLGDYTKAKKELGWFPEVTFEELVKEMVESDIQSLSEGKTND